MTITTANRTEPSATARRVPYRAVTVAVVAIGVIWPGGQLGIADLFFTLMALGLLLGAVVREPMVKQTLEAAPVAAKRGAKVLLFLFLIGQLWGASADTYPVATWTMYSNGPGDEVSVYLFDAVSADGQSVAFTPSSSNRTLPAKMALVYLRNLSSRIDQLPLGSDAEQVEAAEDLLRRTLVHYVELHNANSPDSHPVSIEVTRVTYDVKQDNITVDSGERTVLMRIDLASS